MAWGRERAGSGAGQGGERPGLTAPRKAASSPHLCPGRLLGLQRLLPSPRKYSCQVQRSRSHSVGWLDIFRMLVLRLWASHRGPEGRVRRPHSRLTDPCRLPRAVPQARGRPQATTSRHRLGPASPAGPGRPLRVCRTSGWRETQRILPISVKGCFQAPTLGCVHRCPPSPRSAPLSPLPIHPGKTSSSWPLSPLSELTEPGCGSRLSSTPLASSHVTRLSFPPTKASKPRRRGRGLTRLCALPRDSRHEASPSPSGFIPGRHRRGRGGEGSLLGSWSAFIKEQGLHCVSPLSPSCPGRTGRKTRSRGRSPGGDSCHRRGLLSAHGPPPPAPDPQPLPVLPVGRLGQAVRRKEDTRRETAFCLAVTEGRRLDEPAQLPGAAPLALWEEPRTTIYFLF